MALKLKRVYLKPEPRDGFRVLVDRLWPRGLTKQKARVDRWLRDLAPSNTLRKWYGHDPRRWAGFKRRYRAELKGARQREALAELKRLRREQNTVTLLFSSREERFNNAAALKVFLR
ncbi:MAG TPA: DUF488 family protein [Gammaproteobacteria bacterium]|nr:DUF488 family protein [Gammaproteobacteria bacterium]